MLLKGLTLSGFKSFSKQTTLSFSHNISAIVGPNGSGKSNVAEAVAWVLGEQSLKSLRGKKGEDLIFGGSASAPKKSKASVVLIFSGIKKTDSVSISRIVYRDGTNEYFMNGELCRLKDITEFLAKSGIGISKHHIISQGESDRILSASVKERREIVEDVLGLRIYQMKKEEAKRKLDRTEENIKQAESLRHEIQPHLRFLKKQADKASGVNDLKIKLKQLGDSYFSSTEKYFKEELEKINLKKEEPQKIALELERKRKEIKNRLEKFKREKIDYPQKETAGPEKPEEKDIGGFLESLKEKIERALKEDGVEKIKEILKEIKTKIISFAGQESKYRKLWDALESAKENERAMELERELFQVEIKLREAKSVLQILNSKESELKLRYQEIEKDLEEIEVIAGEKINIQRSVILPQSEIKQQQRAIERLKIRIEESGDIGDEVLKEYEEVQSRDQFLNEEIDDLDNSAKSLKDLIKQLEEKLNKDFKEGVLKINKEFQEFFELMFGGGKAELGIAEDGIYISVDLPRKRIKSLDLLSGGERSLTSIALLFAMSQVNPPPFLVLDEIDAALDESNSRKYAKMLQDLSSRTQLILVTHNRETMNAAGVLYGVTMGRDGISRLLSVKLEEAEELVNHVRRG